IETDEGALVFAADLIPGTAWVHLPITMGYDRFPEMLIDEKRRLLADLHTRGGRLFFTHDPEIASAALQQDERGKYSAANAVHELSLSS
ncbi:MAG: MBL fold metallo-hydrolase, partial [Reinekea sp.]|nr:MBL fold metallo-hydrolase [Reinekea sp.]